MDFFFPGGSILKKRRGYCRLRRGQLPVCNEHSSIQETPAVGAGRVRPPCHRACVLVGTNLSVVAQRASRSGISKAGTCLYGFSSLTEDSIAQKGL